MTTRPGITQDQYLHAPAAGHRTRCRHDHGIPAPWPPDFTTHAQPQQNGDKPL